MCYRNVTRINKLKNDLLELRKKLKRAYDCKQDHRFKRLKSSDVEQDLKTSKRSLVAKALDFSKPSTCTSSSSTSSYNPRPNLDNLQFSPVSGANTVGVRSLTLAN